MNDFDGLDFARGENETTSTAIPCVVTAVDLSGEPMVSVRPQVKRQYDLFDGQTEVLEELEIREVPYVYPSGMSFACFVPPEVGMQGVLIVTDTEVGEVAEGAVATSRRKDPTSGYFLPAGNLTGSAFRGSPDWAELRSDDCRVALSKDTIHLEAGSNSIVLTQDGFDVLVGAISLVSALKQLSAHIRALETLVHPNGMTHGSAHQHLVDQLVAASAPTRAERGVR